MGPDFFMKNRSKNDHSSKSVCSFNLGVIFHHSLGQELSRDAVVVSVYAFGKKLPIRKDFFVTPKNAEIFMKSRCFSKMPRKVPGSFSDVLAVSGSVLECAVN